MNVALLSIGFSKDRKESTKITIIKLAEELNKQGQNAIIITERRRGLKNFEIIAGVKIYRPYPQQKNKVLNLWNYIRAVRYTQKKEGIKFDIIHSFSAVPILCLRAHLTKLFAVKQAKTIHTLKSYARSEFLRFRFARLLNLIDAVSVPTKIFANRLIVNGTNPKKINIIHSNIDIKRFKPMNKSKLKTKYGFRRKKIILYYGAMWEEKGLEYLAKAIPFITKVNSNIIFIIAPRHTRDFLHPYKELIRRLKQFTNIKFVMNINIVDYINMADIVVLPYKSINATEGNPSCLLESMACKTPIVTTDIPELREVVKSEKDVLMAKPKNAKSLAKEINRLLLNKRLQRRLIDNAYNKSKKFDVRKIAKQFIDLYREVLNGS